MNETTGTGAACTWLLLLHQLPAKPAYFRVKIWRRLEGLGSVAVKRAVYALPATEQSKEDFAWLRREIVDGGGEAVVCEAHWIDGLADAEVRALFNAARDKDYRSIAKDLRALTTKWATMTAAGSATAGTLAPLRAQGARLAVRHAQTVAIDFFGANGRQTAEGLLTALHEKLKGEAMSKRTEIHPASAQDLKGRLWVTRQGVHVDRIGCAWLIRRFIDHDAQFRFVPAKGYQPAPGDLRFDMFEAEFTHEGDRCTFEVLVDRAGLGGDPALSAIAEIVHDMDLKDSKYGREEVAGISRLIAGVAAPDVADEQRIERGLTVFDALYDSFGGTRR